MRDDLETVEERHVRIGTREAELDANLVIPVDASALVVIAGDREHDAVLGRFARDMQEARLATLLLHLETPEETAAPPSADGGAAAARRLAAAIDWLEWDASTRRLAVGLLLVGASAEPGLRVAARRDAVRAIGCYDGRDEHGGDHLASVRAPCMLVVDAEDRHLVATGEALARALPAAELQLLPAGHRSIEERLEQTIWMLVRWFERYLIGGRG
jgi:hypothetical protein